MAAHITERTVKTPVKGTVERTVGKTPPGRSGSGETPIGALAALARQLGQGRIWVASASVFVVFAWVFFASSAPFAIPSVEAACGQRPLDMRFFTSGEDVTSFLDGCGPDGRTSYRNMQIADLFYPAVVGLFLASSLSLAIGRLTRRGSSLVLLASIPLVASLFDYLENGFAWLALARYPAPAPTDGVLGYASAAKTITSWVSGLLLIGFVVALGLQAIRRRMQQDHDRSGPSGHRATSV